MSQGWQRPPEEGRGETVRRSPFDPSPFRPSSESALRTPPPARTDPPASDYPTALPERPLTPALTPDFGGSAFGARAETVDLRPGQTVFGKYKVIGPLGSGGMGTVWRVFDTELQDDMAIKLINERTAENPAAFDMFLLEARAMARTKHPNSVMIHTSQLDRRYVVYIVMEYVPGQSLDEYVKPGKPMPLGWTANVLEQLCDVLQVAHEKNIVHRDLKPTNLMLVERPGRPPLLKVLDFGIAKVLGADELSREAQTQFGQFVGTPGYASPEQASGEADSRSDLYSVGVLLYQCLTGRLPFKGSQAVVIANTIHLAPPSFAAANPESRVPAAVEKVVMRCLAKSPADRPQSAKDLAREFLGACDGASTDAPPAQAEAPSTKSGVLTRVGPRTAVVAAAVVVVASTAGLALNAWGRRPTPSPSGGTTVAGSAGPGVNSLTSATSAVKSLPAGPSATRSTEAGKFVLWKSSVYLPEGYRAVETSGLVDSVWPKEIERQDGVRFVRIPSGEFTLGAKDGDPDDTGDNVPARTVALDGYYIQTHEVTNREVEEFLRSPGGKSVDPDDLKAWQDEYRKVRDELGREQAAKYPATRINWGVARVVARHYQGRLPSEAQWERAAKSPDRPSRLVWPDEQADKTVNVLANLFSEADGPVAAGTYPWDQTRDGVTDLIGNVREWCRDAWRPFGDAPPTYAVAEPDPVRDDSARAVVRGGSYLQQSEWRYTTCRGGLKVTESPPDVGFRLVIECPPALSH